MKKSLSILMLGVALSFGSVYAQTAVPNPAVAAAQTNLDQAKAALAKAQAYATSANTAATNANNAVKSAAEAVAKANSDLSAAQAAASKPPAPGASTGTGIKVLMAAYGRNCRAPKPDVTAQLAAACNGKSDCTYTVDHNLIGDTAPGCAKDYVVDYVCVGGNPMVQKTGIAPDASGKSVHLICAAPPMNPQVKQKACLDLAKTQAVPGNFMDLFMVGCMAPPKSSERNQACITQAQAIMHLAPAQMGGFMNECTSRP